MNKKIVPVLIILVLIAVGGAGYFMGQQTAVPATPIEPPPVETLATIVHTTDTTSENKSSTTTDSTPNEEGDYTEKYSDLDQQIFANFMIIYQDSLIESAQTGADPIYDLTLYEESHISDAWTMLGRRVPSNSEALYKVWKIETITPEMVESLKETVEVPVKDEAPEVKVEAPAPEVKDEAPTPAPEVKNPEPQKPAPQIKDPAPQKPEPQKPVRDDTKPGTEQSSGKMDLGEFEDPYNIYDVSGGKITPAPVLPGQHDYHDWVGFN